MAGAVTVTAALSVLVYAIVDAERGGLGLDADDRRCSASRRLLFAVFTVIERRSQAPLVPFSIFRKRTLTGANVVGLLVGASLFSMFFFITLYMQQVLGLQRDRGRARLPAAVDRDHPLGGRRLSARDPDRLQAGVGGRDGVHRRRAGVVQPDLASTAASPPTSSVPRCSQRSASASAFVPTTIAAVSGIQDREQGLASGLINTSQQIGGALGLAVLATIANSTTEDAIADAGGDPAAQWQALVDGFRRPSSAARGSRFSAWSSP